MLDNIKANLLKVSAVGIVALGLVGKAFAQTPIYEMDTAVSSAAQDLVASMTSTYLAVILLVIAAVGGLVVTIFGINKFWGWARGKFLHG